MNSRKALIAGNWKMYKDCQEAVDAARQLVSLVGDSADVETMIAPPFTALSQVASIIAQSPIRLGAQNLYWESEGAFTGEISPGMLLSAGCQYVIIGHSERRQYFGETNETVNRKIKAAVAAGLSPVFCIGESLAQREADETFSVLDKQVENGLKGLFSGDLRHLVIAYEPVWAIGTGQTATSEQAQQVHKHIRQWLADHLDANLADGMRILYGGSVKPANVKQLMAMPDIDGALVGGASLDPATFNQLVHYRR